MGDDAYLCAKMYSYLYRHFIRDQNKEVVLTVQNGKSGPKGTLGKNASFDYYKGLVVHGGATERCLHEDGEQES